MGSNPNARIKNLDFILQGFFRGNCGGFENTQRDKMLFKNQIIPLQTMDTRHQTLVNLGKVEREVVKRTGKKLVKLLLCKCLIIAAQKILENFDEIKHDFRIQVLTRITKNLPNSYCSMNIF